MAEGQGLGVPGPDIMAAAGIGDTVPEAGLGCEAPERARVGQGGVAVWLPGTVHPARLSSLGAVTLIPAHCPATDLAATSAAALGRSSWVGRENVVSPAGRAQPWMRSPRQAVVRLGGV